MTPEPPPSSGSEPAPDPRRKRREWDDGRGGSRNAPNDSTRKRRSDRGDGPPPSRAKRDTSKGGSGKGSSGRNGPSGKKGSSGGNGSAKDGSGGGRPPWLIPAAIGVSVLLIMALVVRSCTSGGSGGSAADCMGDLAEHIPAEAGDLVVGTDLPRARDAGYTDSESLNDVGESLLTVGALADPVTDRFRYQRLIGPEAFQARTGVTTDDIRCSLSVGDGGEIAALSASFETAILAGSFDEAEVNGSAAGAAGDLAANDDRLAMVLGGDSASLLEVADDNLASEETVMLVMDHLLDSDVHSFVVQRAPSGDDGDEDEREPSDLLVTGMGVGRSGDDTTLVAAWVFTDEDAAAEARPAVTEAVNELATGSASIRVSDLELEDNVLRLELPTREPLDLGDLIRRHGGPMGPLA